MSKKNVECAECGNEATIFTHCKEELMYCPFCGEYIPIMGTAMTPSGTDDEDDDGEFDDGEWPSGGC